MIGVALLLVTALSGSSAAQQAVEEEAPAAVIQERSAFRWSAPSFYIEGEPFVATLVFEGPEQEALAIPTWHLRRAGFLADGRPFEARDIEEQLLHLDQGSRLEVQLDLGEVIASNEDISRKPFRLSHVALPDFQVDVGYLRGAAKGIDFMTMPVEQLGGYQVILKTNRGLMRLGFWPETAPNHVRSFLDLSYSGFYDGSNFHRVIPGFMIQGGQSATGAKAPRKLNAEFSDRRHVPGVLSAARLGHDINSATSEFFICHATYPSLDGKYTAFGQLVEGLAVVDLIANAGDKRYRAADPRHSKPPEPQVIERAIVIRAPRSGAPESGR